MKRILLLVLSAVAITALHGQNGFIYVHAKSLSENVASNNSSYSLTGATNLNFTLNDLYSIDANVYDMGVSHGAGGDGLVWAAASGTFVLDGHHATLAGLYYRAPSSTAWIRCPATPTGTSVDGVGNGTAVYTITDGTNAAYDGSAYAYSMTVSTNTFIAATEIWNRANHANIKLFDIASGGPGGIIVAVGSDGNLYRYTGNQFGAGGSVADSWVKATSWTAASGNGNAWRVDVRPATQEVVVLTLLGTIVRFTGWNTGYVTFRPAEYGSAGPAPGSNALDIAFDDNGKIYATMRLNLNTSFYVGSAVWSVEYNPGSTSGYTINPTGGFTITYTGGAGGQVWGGRTETRVPSSYTILSKAISPTENIWLDDERIRTSTPANSIIIPVAAGSYTLRENATAGWTNTDIKVYDPSGNSTANLGTSTVNLTVAAGEVVNVVYENTANVSTSVAAGCGINLVQDYGTGGAAFAGPLAGLTPFHYAGGTAFVSDGYYCLPKTTSGSAWVNTSVDDHTGNGGYFAVFNASYPPDEFFQQTLTDLIVGQTYQLSFWAADLSPRSPLRPNVMMGVTDVATGQVLGSVTTGNIYATSWTKYNFNFTPTSTTIQIFLRNNNVGGSGNDLAIDDIAFNLLPLPVPTISGPTLVCTGNPDSAQFNASPVGGVWSSSKPDSVAINSVTGKAIAKLTTSDSAILSYTYTNIATGCISDASVKIGLGFCALPITLTAFTAEVRDCNQVELNWSTENAHNFSHFEVERSNNGLVFGRVGTVTFNANQSGYRFVDNAIAAGNYEYRLKLINKDGSYEFSATKAVKVNCGETSIEIVPTLVHNQIEIKGLNRSATLHIYNTAGALVLSRPAVNSNEKIEIGHLVAGMYMVQVIQDNKVISSKKIFKQ